MIGIAPQSQQNILIALDQLLLFEQTNSDNPYLLELDDAAPSALNDLIALAVYNRRLRVTFEWSQGWAERLEIFVLHIFHTQATWLIEVYDFEAKAVRQLPVLNLKHSQFSEEESPENLDYFADCLLYLGSGIQLEKLPDGLRARLNSRLTNLQSKL